MSRKRQPPTKPPKATPCQLAFAMEAGRKAAGSVVLALYEGRLGTEPMAACRAIEACITAGIEALRAEGMPNEACTAWATGHRQAVEPAVDGWLKIQAALSAIRSEAVATVLHMPSATRP